MIRDIFRDHFCKWCERELSASCLARFRLIPVEDVTIYPLLCMCGGINLIPVPSDKHTQPSSSTEKDVDDE